jgi:hypothetical protein
MPHILTRAALFGFGDEPEAKTLYAQAASELGVVANTDGNADAARGIAA